MSSAARRTSATRRAQPVPKTGHVRSDLRNDSRSSQSRDHRVAHAAVIGQAQEALQHLGGARDAAIHAVIEQRVIEPGGKLVAAQRVPIFVAIDRLRRRERHGLHVGRARVGFHVFAVIVDGDAELGRPARIGRMVGIAALMRQKALKRILVCRCRHALRLLAMRRLAGA
jgi:hypothetical protein